MTLARLIVVFYATSDDGLRCDFWRGIFGGGKEGGLLLLGSIAKIKAGAHADRCTGTS